MSNPSFLRFCFVAILGASLTTTARSAEFFVAPNGNDHWSGKLAEPNAERTDGPLASPVAARDAIRRARSAGQLQGAVSVKIRSGVYRLDAPLVFEPADSGTALAMGKTKVENIVKSGADVVVSPDISCLMHVGGMLRHDPATRHIRCVHIAEVLLSNGQ